MKDLGTIISDEQDSVTDRENSIRSRRERILILTLLLAPAAASWAILIWQSRTANEMDMGLTMGMGATLFLAIWAVMMIAMMFPTVAPMILTLAWVQHDRRNHPIVSTWVFVGAYLLVWVLFGVMAYLGALAASGLAQQVPWTMMNAARIGGGILFLAGLYQLTPLKRVCLAKCRAPHDFILYSWPDGFAGSFRMGLKHGIYCLGCNWLFFVLLFPLGIMNIAAMALLTILIFAEKVFPSGEHIAQIVALVLIFYGTLVIVAHAALPLNVMGM